MVEDGQRQRLEDDRLGEAALDGEHGRAGEEELALGVADHVAGEVVAGEPVAGLLVDHRAGRQLGELVGGVREARDRLDEPAGAGDDAVAPSLGEPPGEDLEDAPPLGRPVAQGGLQHGQLVVVGQQTLLYRETLLDAHGGQPRLGGMSVAPMEVEEADTDQVVVPDKPWVTIVWNDPVNLMSYVAFVFQKHFGYPKEKAHKLMLDVHEKGKAVVSNGTREEMERDVEAMHGYGLWATMQHDE